MECPLLNLPDEVLVLIANHLVQQPKLGAAHNFSRQLSTNPDPPSPPPPNRRHHRSSIASQALAQFISDRALANSNQAVATPSHSFTTKDTLRSFDGYTGPNDLLSLAATCRRLRSLIGSRIWHSIVVGDSARRLPHRSPLVRSSQVPGLFQYSFENELSMDILSHVVHLQLNTSTTCTVVNGPSYSENTAPWVQLLDPRVSPNLESIILIAQYDRDSISPTQECTFRKAAAQISAHCKQVTVTLVTNAPIAEVDAVFLTHVETAEWTLTEPFTDLSKLSRVTSLSLAADSPTTPVCVVLPEHAPLRYLNVESTVSLVDPLPCSAVGIIWDWSQMGAFFGAYHSLTDLCVVVDPGASQYPVQQLHHPDKVVSGMLPANFLPNLERLAIVSTEGAPHLEPALLTFLETTGGCVSGLYISGFSSRFVVAALAHVPQLVECHVACIKDPAPSCLLKPLKPSFCTSPEQTTSARAPPCSFADQVLGAAAKHTPHLASLWLCVPSVSQVATCEATVFTTRKRYKSALSRLPHLTEIHLIESADVIIDTSNVPLPVPRADSSSNRLTETFSRVSRVSAWPAAFIFRESGKQMCNLLRTRAQPHKPRFSTRQGGNDQALFVRPYWGQQQISWTLVNNRNE